MHFMSDLHLEFHTDGGKEFLGGLNHPEVEVLALGGDITHYGNLIWQIPLFHQAYPNAQIIYIKGNHEFYGGAIDVGLHCFDKVAKKFPFVHFLEPGVEITLQTHRFIGATMWFKNWNPKLESLLNDFTMIRCPMLGGFKAWVQVKNQEWIDFYQNYGQPGDIVITHHIPSWQAVSPQYQGDPANCFYVCNIEQLILEKKPKLWLHGHSHEAIDINIGDTRLIRNPLGYPYQIPAYWTPKEIVLQ